MSLSITIDDAIARIINIDHIPMEFNDILEYLDNIALKVETEIEEATQQEFDKNIEIDEQGIGIIKVPESVNKDSNTIEMLKIRLETANFRFQYAEKLRQDINWEIENNLENSILKIADNNAGALRLDLKSVIDWAKQNHAIGRFNYEELSFEAKSETEDNTYLNQAIDHSNRGLSGLLTKRFLITFAYTIEELVQIKNNTKEYGTAENINVSKVAADLLQRIINFRGEEKNYDLRSLRNRIEIALAMKSHFGEHNP
jgi:hypothetical protein